MDKINNSQNYINSIFKKKILSFSTRPLWKLHYAMEISLINYLSKNNTVISLFCDHSLDSCEVNPIGDSNICNECVKFQCEVKNRIASEVKFDSLFKNNILKPHLQINYSPANLLSVDSLIKLKVEDFEVGKAILNHIIPNYGMDVNLRHPHISRLVKRLLYSLVETYFFLKKYISDQDIELGIIFNGRFPHESAFVAACKINLIDFIIHERGADPAYIGIFVNRLPHLLCETAENAKKIDLNKLTEVELEKVKEFASAPYKKWVDQNFNVNQIKNLLPDINKKLITIFLSSQEEFVAVPGCIEEPTFYQRIEKLLNDVSILRVFKNYQIIVRDHPNSLRFSQANLYKKLLSNFDFVSYYPPESNIDSYALLNNSEFIITFGSTIGLEALCRGIRVVCLTQYYSPYAVNLPGVISYDPYHSNSSELLKFINYKPSTQSIIETGYKISASILSYDVKLPGWKYLVHNNIVSINC